VALTFETDAQKAIYEKIGQFAKELFGEFAIPRTDFPAYFIRMGSATVNAAVWAWGKDDAIINVRSWVVTGAEKNPGMLEYLLRENEGMRFGAFGMDDKGDILFEHTIVGSQCSKEELRASVMAVIGTADKADDEIVSRWGGKRAVDRT
jgi:hypothetical protein